MALFRVDGNLDISEWVCTECTRSFWVHAQSEYDECPICHSHNDPHKNTDFYKWSERKISKA